MLSFGYDFYDSLSSCYTCGDEIFAKVQREREKGVSGYYALPFENRACEDLAGFVSKNEELLTHIENLVLIGVGGSSLGAKAIHHLLRYTPLSSQNPQSQAQSTNQPTSAKSQTKSTNQEKNRKATSHKKAPKIYFLEHTDALSIPHILSKIMLDSTLFIAISKSGGTIETSSLLKYVISRFSLLDSSEGKSHLLCITDEGSALQSFAKKEGVECISIAPSVGGRFSVLSAVGLLPLGLLGYDIAQILRGAREFMERFFARKEEHILAKASFLAKNYECYPITTLFSYSSIFREFNAWFVQLWGESLGKIDKDGKRVGLSPVGLIGSIDQHSFLQLIIEGRTDKTVTFLSIAPSALPSSPKIPLLSLHSLESSDFVNGVGFAELLDRQRLATFQSLENLQYDSLGAESNIKSSKEQASVKSKEILSKIPLDSIVLNELSERSVGALIAYFELLTSAVGCALDIDTYNQPGVELGKVLLKKGFSK
ncbi:hypothetical protein [Helicobacter macacae]|uniref:Glucose-6-phosphate isomerase n=1 Tax=Helicobacter macacae MIT 99-5501 TaxID=1357400 RepID=V8CBR0_9HELI|nr:hypothetical protein [Helicobacter macacae]ETD24809.1 hypothetical protein HMPREF2086_00143 [Helicobacter macacae MIT 99-5501]